MEPLAITLTDSLHGTRHLAHSALPDAPVLPHRDRAPRLTRSRSAVAALLVRTARAVEPAHSYSSQPHPAH